GGRRASKTTTARRAGLAGRALAPAGRGGWPLSPPPPRLGRGGAQHEPANTLPCVQEQRTGAGSYSTHGVSYASCRQPTSTSVSIRRRTWPAPSAYSRRFPLTLA